MASTQNKEKESQSGIQALTMQKETNPHIQGNKDSIKHMNGRNSIVDGEWDLRSSTEKIRLLHFSCACLNIVTRLISITAIAKQCKGNPEDVVEKRVSFLWSGQCLLDQRISSPYVLRKLFIPVVSMASLIYFAIPFMTFINRRPPHWLYHMQRHIASPIMMVLNGFTYSGHGVVLAVVVFSLQWIAFLIAFQFMKTAAMSKFQLFKLLVGEWGATADFAVAATLDVMQWRGIVYWCLSICSLFHFNTVFAKAMTATTNEERYSLSFLLFRVTGNLLLDTPMVVLDFYFLQQAKIEFAKSEKSIVLVSFVAKVILTVVHAAIIIFHIYQVITMYKNIKKRVSPYESSFPSVNATSNQ